MCSDLGSGKSVLARGMIRALVGDPKLGVASPTFLLDITYPTETATYVVARHVFVLLCWIRCARSPPPLSITPLVFWFCCLTRVHHFDLYRLSGPDDFDGLGIEDALKDGVLCAVVITLRMHP
mgnify:CR=1 FL=1